MIQDLNENNIPGLIIDLRWNTGGNGYLADQMAAYFFDEELVAGSTAYYDDSIGEFYADPGNEDRLFPPREELRYYGTVVAIVGPACASACEFFAYDLTLQNRVTIVGHYPTAGLGGSVEDFVMPEDVIVQFTIGRAVDNNGEIHIEGRGVEPDIDIPVTEETVSAEYLDGNDVLLEQALKVVKLPRGAGITPSGPPKIATQEEAISAAQAYAPYLEDLARETYDEELYEPATVVYNVPMGRSQEVLWVTGWCASPDQFEQNWENITLVMTLDGEEIPLDRFVIADNPSDEANCRYYFTALSEWPYGEHVLTTEMTFATRLDDGMQDQLYAPGTRVYEYRVYISR